MRVMLIVERPDLDLWSACEHANAPGHAWPLFKRVDVVYVPLPYQAP